MKALICLLLFSASVLYAQVPTPSSKYHFNEVSGTTTYDAIGTNHGTIGAGITMGSAGKLNTCFTFSGANDSKVVLGDVSTVQFGQSNFSLEVYVKPVRFDLQPKNGIIGGEDYAATLYVTAAGYLGFGSVNYGDANASYLTVPIDGNFHCIQASYNHSTHNLILGVDGQYVNISYTVDFGSGAASNGIGYMTPNISKWIGAIDEPTIWNVALTQAQLLESYSGPQEPELNVAEIKTFDKKYGSAGRVYFRDRRYQSGSTIKTFDTKLTRADILGDTMRYLLYDDFESWTNADVQSEAALENKIDHYGYVRFDRSSIVYDGAQHGNAWQILIPQGQWNGMGMLISLDTAVSELYVSYDMKMDPVFTVSSSYKTGMGMYGGNNLAPDDSHLQDTTNTGYYACGLTGHPVGGASGSQFGYNYIQDRNDGVDWTHGWGVADSGYYPPSQGIWHNYIVHLYSGTLGKGPGKYDGYMEIYRDQELIIRYSGLKYRSLMQGDLFGKIEAVFMEYFYGGEETPPYAAALTQWVRFDNLAFYQYLPNAASYHPKMRARGATIPDATRPGSYARKGILHDQTYTASSGDIYDTGPNTGYIWNPPHDVDSFTVEIIRPSGTINYRFDVAEWGYGPESFNQDYYVMAYRGTGAGKVPLHKFGRSARNGWLPLYTSPAGTYNSGASSMTLVYHIGTCGQAVRGTKIHYDSVP